MGWSFVLSNRLQSRAKSQWSEWGGGFITGDAYFNSFLRVVLATSAFMILYSVFLVSSLNLNRVTDPACSPSSLAVSWETWINFKSQNKKKWRKHIAMRYHLHQSLRLNLLHWHLAFDRLLLSFLSGTMFNQSSIHLIFWTFTSDTYWLLFQRVAWFERA